MKNILFGLFLLISFPVCSQYYYKDLVSTRQTAQQFSLLKKAGVKKLSDGLGMLVYQGAIAFKLWTGYDAPVEVMKKALAAEFADG